VSTKHWVFIHGIFSDGSESIDRLRPFFECAGHTVEEMDYGWSGPLGARADNPERAERLATLTRHRASEGKCVAWLAHSNGNAIGKRALDLPDLSVDQWIMLNPALDVDIQVGPGVRRIDVVSGHDDRAVELARLIPGSIWGALGSRGYAGTDERFHQWWWEDLFDNEEDIGHSGWAIGDLVGKSGPWLTWLAGQ